MPQILGYATEVFKSECAGVLMGDSFESMGKVVVNYAVALQSAKRSTGHITAMAHRYKRIEEMLSFLALDWIVGEFHSHTEYGENLPAYTLSSDDRKYIAGNHHVGGIEIVVALRKKKRAIPWGYPNNDMVLSGSVGNYSFEIAAFYKADDDDGGTMTSLWCPIVPFIEIAEELGLPSKRGYIFDHIPPQFPKQRYRKLVRLVCEYEDIVIKKLDESAGKGLLDQVKQLMKEVAALKEIYG